MRRHAMEVCFLFFLLLVVLSFQAQVYADVYVANMGNASVTVYQPSATGNAAPIRTIAGAATGLIAPGSVTADTVNNELYVADFHGQAVRVFALNANGNSAPLRTLVQGPNSNIGQVREVAVDTTNNEIYVLGNNQIHVFLRAASGDAVPTRTISGGNTLLANPISIVLDLVHNEIVTNCDSGVGRILIFNRTDNGNVAPLREISGSNTHLGSGTTRTAVDLTSDEIYSAGDSLKSVVVFSRTANGNVAPLRILTGAATDFVSGMLLDVPNNRLIVVDGSPNTINVFPRTGSGAVVPLMFIAGPQTGLSSPYGLAMDSLGGFTGFNQVGTAVTVPTMTEWGMIILTVFLGMVSVYYLRRRGSAI